MTNYELRKSLESFFRSTSFKITLLLSVLILSLFGILNAIVLQQSRAAFIDTVGGIKFNIADAGQVYQLYSPYGDATFTQPIDVLRYNADGSERPKPLQEIFTEVFQNSLIRITLLGIVASIIIGYITARIFINPLNQLSKGMQKLKDNNYKFKLKKTGTEEFDNVVDEFNNLTKELQKVEDLRKDLISDTSHELKTPITSLLGQLEGVKDGVFEMDNARINSLMEQVQRLNSLVDHLQEFSRLRSKNKKLEIVNFRLKELLEDITKDCDIDLKKMKLNLDIDEDYVLSADKELIRRIFCNLIQNSVNYSQGKNIHISAKDKLINFKDDGVGIPEVHLPYIFERFYRVEKSRNRATGGMGLGLAIVKEIIEAHGWKVEVKNLKPGLEFIIEL